jgi:thiol:disulfide interchange protein/DsbC/DsbD-like thiol-disulfide interchange protein
MPPDQRAARWKAHVLWAVALAFILIGSVLPSHAAAPGSNLVKAELLAEPSAVTPGEPFWVALKLQVQERWHVYWRNPGDSGEAVAITWHLPSGFAAGPIVWPTPQRIPVAHLANFGYEVETTLLTRITPPAALDRSTPLELKADVTWLVCEKECIPGEASLSLRLPVADAASSDSGNPATRGIFEAARNALPRPSPWAARLALAPDRVTLEVDTKGLDPTAMRSALFFPNEPVLIQHAAPQQLGPTGTGFSLRLERSALSTRPPADGGGVLVVEEALGGGTTARHAFELADVAIGSAPAPAGIISPAAVLQAMLFAVLGGILLNLMPCVFPVLSIKVLALVEQAGGSRSDLRRHGAVYTGGVLAAFLALGAALLGVRAAGGEVGWGFQLQSPVVVALLAYLLLAMGLSLSGVFHFGSSLQGVGLGLSRRPGLAGSFFAGVLAAVVATPCTAPFMASAVGFALTQPVMLALAVIMALGLGLALPFLVLTHLPGLVGRLPRPGAWMETLRQLLAFPVYATVAWLVWVLGQQVGPAGLFAALVGLVLVGLAAWSFNRVQTTGGWGRRTAGGLLAASLAGLAIAVGALGSDQGRPASVGSAQAASDARAEPFNQARLDQLLAEGRPVFVNMTAAWCITCLVNERAALSSEAVRAAFAAKNVTYLKGDWTNRNPEITRVLEKHGRSGVPLYLLYTGRGQPVVLPQILTPAMVLAEVERIADPRQHKASLSTSAKE